MVPELEKPRVTEIKVRMDCNGCVQKIKKALNGINGIYDIYIDIPQQKLTIIGWADPEKIVKAIKKTRKTATICSHTTPTESETLPEGGAGEALPPDHANPPPRDEGGPVGQTPPAEPQQLTPENPPPEVEATGQSTGSAAEPPQASGSREVEEVHVVYRYPPDHQSNVRVYSGRVDRYPSSRHEPPPQPIHVNHSYNTYKPTPYVTEYEHIHPPPPRYARYSQPQPQHYSQPEPPPHRSRPEPPQHRYSQPESPRRNSRPDSPPPPQHSQPEPPQPYAHGSPEPPRQYTHYSRSEPPQQHSYYSHVEPPQQYSYYNRPEPQYTRYERPGPPQYNRQVPPEYMHYTSDYHSSYRNGNITSIFSDEDPNGCKIV